MKAKEIIKDIKAGKVAPLYLLHGLEPFFIDQVTEVLENGFLDESEKAFDQIVAYAKDTDFLALISSARRAPMMSRKNVVILKEAQARRIQELEPLEHYVKQPVDSTVFVMCYKGKLDKRKALYKAFVKNKAVILESAEIKDYQVGTFVMQFIQEKGFKGTPEAVRLLAESLGTNIAHIQNELQKLTLNIKGTKIIDEKIVEKYIGINRTYNVFELQKSVSQKQKGKALRIVQYVKSNPKAFAIQQLIPVLFKHFREIYTAHHFKHLQDKDLAKKIGMRNAYFIKDTKLAMMNYSPQDCKRIFSLLLTYDLRSKGVENGGNTPSGELMHEMVAKIMN